MAQQEFKTGSSLGFATGTICTDTSLYKCTDGKIEYIEYIGAGDVFPNFPGGNGKGKAKWYKLTLATDGDRYATGFTAVKVEAGTL